jgi:hypothetical protein
MTGRGESIWRRKEEIIDGRFANLRGAGGRFYVFFLII